ncbi:MAG TPA: hemolysin III family protein, partial [Hyphomicrobiaceae bacterium]|nr:hemolysin III family protein [Hyphomicrobiaceae bacterium]
VPLYLALGWVGVIMFQSLSGAVAPDAIVLLWVGGIVYSAGLIFHLWRNLPYQNVIWHLFVLGGTACHFGAVTSAMFA